MLFNSCKSYCKGYVSMSSGQRLLYLDIRVNGLTSPLWAIRNRNAGHKLWSPFTSGH